MGRGLAMGGLLSLVTVALALTVWLGADEGPRQDGLPRPSVRPSAPPDPRAMELEGPPAAVVEPLPVVDRGRERARELDERREQDRDVGRLRVVDGSGQPLDQACVFAVLGKGLDFRGMVGADGRAPALAPGRHVVACRGHLATAVTLPERGEVTVSLPRAARLEVRVGAPADLPADEFSVVVRGSSGLQPLGGNAMQAIVEHRGDPGWSERVVHARGVDLHLPLNEREALESHGWAQRLVALDDLVPGEQVEVELRDRWQEVLQTSGPLLLTAGTRRLDLDVAALPHSLDVTVRTSDGSPFPHASVTLRMPDGQGSYRGVTDDDGRYVFERLFTERVTLEIHQPGWLPYRTEVLAAAGRVDIVLGQGRALEVSLVDGRHGGVVPAESLRASWTVDGVVISDRPVSTSCGVDGRSCQLDGVPEAALDLRAVVGGRVYETVHDVRSGPLRWELPCHGGLALELGERVEDGALLAVRLDDLDGAGEPVERQLHHDVELPLALGAVREGRYRVSLSAFDGRGFSPLGAPRDVVVRAHEDQALRWD